MTDTELILNKLDDLRTELKADIGDLRTELKTDIGDLRTELKTDIGDLRTELKADMEDLHIELDGKIASVRLSVDNLKEHMDVIEYGLQTQIEKTYEQALQNAENIKLLMAYHGKLAGSTA